MTRTGDILGYARFSTSEQNTSAQTERLKDAGAIRVFEDVISGKKFELFGAIAHFERRLISERTRDGIAARKRGKTPGRPSLDKETVSALQKLIGPGLTSGQAAKQLGIGRSTACRAAQTKQ